MPGRPRGRLANGPTPSEMSHGRGTRPSVDLFPQPDMDYDILAYKRAVMQTDPTVADAELDFYGDIVNYDEYGRALPTLRERGHTPIVRERGRGDMDDRLDPTNPYLYEQREGVPGADPNESWRKGEVSDPLRVGWEEGNYDPEVNQETAAYKAGTGEQAWISNAATSMRDRNVRKIKRVGGPPMQHYNPNGEADPRREEQPWT
ncbi:hypothetical protein SEA_OTTERSTEDTS21_91 [Gordonia phage OtterstedtS21]|uniref:Uncharacterized protein n=1 Tax=Gordonia phage OtterstedtS21 TaxID=2927260 RepID=A0A9E7QPQ5_9CAUD|nr:hypothetical protein SEA_OTTERSTEDTS21_91 [Gordonia phage OtterstedtS21]